MGTLPPLPDEGAWQWKRIPGRNGKQQACPFRRKTTTKGRKERNITTFPKGRGNVKAKKSPALFFDKQCEDVGRLFLFVFLRARDQNLVDARPVHVHDFEREAVPFERVATARDALQAVENQPGQRVVAS